MENKIPTAEEFYQRAMDDQTIGDDITDLMNAYAKMHVESALKVASENVTETIGEEEIKRRQIDEIILESYPLTNIK